MALPRTFRFPVSHEDAFPSGALLVGEATPATERQSDQDRARGREPRQRIDEETMLPMWHVVVTDMGWLRRSESSVTVVVLSSEEPALPDPVASLEAVGVRVVEFVGLKVQPRLGGQGEFRHLTWAYTAEGMRAPQVAAAPASKPAKSAGSGEGSGSSPGGR